jgi:hypothetical protein
MTTSFWTRRRLGKLRQMWGKRTAIEIATELGTTRNAVIGRFHRMMGSYEEANAKRQAVAKEVARRKRKLKEGRQRAIVATMLKRIGAGSPRDKAIARARAEGGTLQSIGTAIGLTRERVRQIVAVSLDNLVGAGKQHRRHL